MQTILEFINGQFDFLINRPMLMLVVMAFPFWIAASWLKLYPSKRLLYFLSIPAVLSVALVLFPISPELGGLGTFNRILFFIGVLDCLLIGVAALDAALTLRPKNFACKRNSLRTASQGKKYSVEIDLTNKSKWGCQIAMRDDLPQSFEADPLTFQTWMKGISRTQFTYEYVCNERGLAELNVVHLLVRSPLGLWRGFYKLPCETTINVYPDMQQITEYDLLARTNRLNLMGLRRSRKIGQDNEFERLRDYTQDDNFKHIDWRATARRHKLTVRDFQANQSQRIIFLIDCGRMMTGTSDDDMSMLDHSVNAMLMLSYVALRQGDSVGMISFSDRVHNYIPPKSGVKHINRLLHASYNLEATHVESRYDDAFMYLRTHCLKRSLVVLATNVIDDINALQIKQYLQVLNGRHLPLAVFLRDHAMFEAIEEYQEAAAPTESSIYQASAAATVLTWRHQIIRDLKHQGVLALDLFPEQLTAELVNQYLEIKARHLL